MAHRVLEVTFQSAKDLKNVNFITRMEVYAVATISGEPLTRQCTPTDPYGGCNPTWNTTLRFDVPSTAAAAGGCLHVLLRTEGILTDRDVGEVIVPLSEILADAGPYDLGPRPPQFASYQVRKVHRTEPRGLLHLLYHLGPVIAPLHPLPYTGFPLVPPPSPPPRAPGHVATRPTPPPPQAPGYVAVPAWTGKNNGNLEFGTGHVAVPPSLPSPPPRVTGHVATRPTPPHPQAPGYVAVPAWTGKNNGNLEFGMGHVAVPPSLPPSPPRVTGQVATPPPPQVPGHVAVPARTGNKNNSKLEFGMGLVGGASGRMQLAGDTISDGHRARLTDG